ncbi:hypothetical protein D3C87_2112350 [compost metagenome]
MSNCVGRVVAIWGRFSSSRSTMPFSANCTASGVLGSAARMGIAAVICEASTWFWIRRLFNSGTLSWCDLGSLIMR